VGDASGLTGIKFDGAWQTSGTTVVGAVAPQTMTATRYREDTMVAWSTSTSCHLSRVSAGITSARPYPCLAGRIAMNSEMRSGLMVFEDGADKVMISEIRVGGESEIANQRLLVEGARAPKIVVDGIRYWVSYINVRQDVVVGYIGSEGTGVSMALEGTQPMGDGYELAVLNGGLWVFAVDGAGVGAQRLCLKGVR
jgi:hypothetical protein